jgi:hypothetical protein
MRTKRIKIKIIWIPIIKGIIIIIYNKKYN